MTHLEAELDQLKEAIIQMMALAKTQLKKSKTAFLNCDADLAQEIVHNEKRMNAMELSIDRDCENILALFQPVATDLRFVISMLKINSDLERVGDYADGIADYVIELDMPIEKQVLERLKVARMFDIAIAMMTDVQTAYDDDNTSLARKVYKQDVELNKINRTASVQITELIKENLDNTRPLLYLFSTVRKLERAGDHIKNITEDIIFHLEAEVIKHKKRK